MEKSIPFSSHINIHSHICLELFWLVNSVWTVQISLLIQTRLFTRESNILDFSWRQWFEVKTSYWWICFLQTRSFSLLQMLTDGLEWCGLLVDYCDVFIHCLDSHSDGTHSLQKIHWWASDGMLHFSKSDEETNSSTYLMAWGWAKRFPYTISAHCK